ncbi:hypothetical protein ABB37_03904 [Leptomonas pyrrhocoris]|uniref:Calponin-homology (CH) domain-containing protein n=1 Tax=Leptomonas pyrrhocoris TaxID=157538 RepID=A0A0M9G3M4_LEPPY|nr:hypothetical protein ABB37_03904 [Leptomonas pyrrhocoris]KPA81563.1 hypothetical protein ABB37_03904 [Leptomonas pyrrhocoris]|eukprot:XP_015660002.1 hypothetical protein ABB37_03904 [Leptomonas pyrrhocoris]
MSHSFSEQERYDLKEIFRIYDFSKVDKVGDVVADAERKGTSAAELFDSLYALYKITKLPQREAVAKRLHMAVTTASDADVESVLRQTEMKGFSERDATRSLERKCNVQHVTNRSLQAARNSLNSRRDDKAVEEEQSELQRTTSQLRHVTVSDSSASFLGGSTTAVKAENGNNKDGEEESSVIFARPPSHLSAAPTRDSLDEVMSEEIREWLGKMLGDAHNSDVLALPNFIDALRNGVLLHVLLQKMQDPPVADADLKLPKRSTGFFIRDNVATFLAEAKRRFNLVDAQLFTDSDLVDGKSDRQVVTCLMAMARIAYNAGSITFAPNIIMYEHEIEQQGSKLTKTDLDRIVSEAEAAEAQSIPTLQTDEKAAAEEGVEETPDTEPDGINADISSKEPADEQALEDASALVAPRSDAARKVDLPSTAADEKSPLSDAYEKETREDGDVAPEADEASQGTAPLQDSALDISHPATMDRTMSPAKSKSSRDHSATPERRSTRDTTESTFMTTPPPEAVAADATETTAVKGEDSPLPPNADAHPTEERCIPSAEAQNASSAPKSDTSEVKHSDADEGDDGDGVGGSGRVFYLRAGMLCPTRPTPEEAAALQARRKKAAPRVVWKSPSTPLNASRPPRYHSRHWDGIDVALGRHLNEHYATHPQSPWRFHMVASTSGEYVLHNRQNAQKRIVYLRIIQTRLFLRNTGKDQPWVRIDEALGALERS